jgi:hypothetical protein
VNFVGGLKVTAWTLPSIEVRRLITQFYDCDIERFLDLTLHTTDLEETAATSKRRRIRRLDLWADMVKEVNANARPTSASTCRVSEAGPILEAYPTELQERQLHAKIWFSCGER